MVCQKDPLVQKICELYDKISQLESLKPSEDVNMLFTQLVRACIPPSPIDVTKTCKSIQEMRSKLIRLCGEAEGLLEKHYSTRLSASFQNPVQHLDLFPYFSNYLKLGRLEFEILSQHCKHPLTRIAFVGSGPLPLTSIVLASYHLKDAVFHNYDIDVSANEMATRLVQQDPDLSTRMFFHTSDILDVTDELSAYDVVFLAALVGMDREEKGRVVDHLAKHMNPGGILMLRSAHGARAFLYPVIDMCDLRGFEALSVYHPIDDVINSVIIARKSVDYMPIMDDKLLDHTGFGSNNKVILTKCAEICPVFNPLNQLNMIEELAVDEHLS